MVEGMTDYLLHVFPYLMLVVGTFWLLGSITGRHLRKHKPVLRRHRTW